MKPSELKEIEGIKEILEYLNRNISDINWEKSSKTSIVFKDYYRLDYNRVGNYEVWMLLEPMFSIGNNVIKYSNCAYFSREVQNGNDETE